MKNLVFSPCVFPSFIVRVEDLHMASSLCLTCNKNVAFFTCCTCGRDFCEDHINEHHQTPMKQFDDFLSDHAQFEQMLHDYLREPRQHPLLQQIDKWERQSIRQIQQVADENRKKLLTLLPDHLTNIENSRKILSDQLEAIRHDEKSLESFLHDSKDKLNKLKTNLLNPSTIRLRKNDDDLTFISKLVLFIIRPEDLFDRTAGNIRIEDDGQVVVHSQWSDHASVRGKGEYSSGQHRFRFQIEEFSEDKWAFFGIVSKSAPIKAISIATPTAFGLAGQDGICQNGIYQTSNNHDYRSDMEINDKFELFIDCDQHFIRLTNERTLNSYQLPIPIEQCPFPWQILLGLCCSAGDRIRILPCTYQE